MKTLRQALIAAGVLVGAVAIVAVVLFDPHAHGHDDRRRRTDSRNLRQIAMLLLGRALERESGRWPPYSGRAFVLAPLALGLLSSTDERHLRVFHRADRDLDDIDWSIYQGVTKEALADSTRDWSKYTDYAGRRNAHPEHRLTDSEVEGGNSPILALLLDDGALLAFADGSIRFVSKEELGLGPDDPILVGDDAKSAQLRALGFDGA